MKTLNVKLDDWTHKHFKAIAALKEMTTGEVIRAMVEREIVENPDLYGKKEEPQEKKSKAKGEKKNG